MNAELHPAPLLENCGPCVLLILLVYVVFHCEPPFAWLGCQLKSFMENTRADHSHQYLIISDA